MKDDRNQTLLTIMIQTQEYISSKELSRRTGCSQKTMQTRMKSLREELVSHGAVLETKKGYGFHLQIIDAEQFSAYVNKEMKTEHSDKTRFYQIMQKLFLTDDYVKAEDLCDHLFISKSTLTYELNYVRKYVKQFALLLEQRPYYGMKLCGNEFHKRLCMADLFINRSEPLTILKEPEFNEVYLRAVLVTCFHKFKYDMNDATLDNLTIHIQIAIQRMQHGLIVDGDMEGLEIPKERMLYEIVEEINIQLKAAFDIELPQGEQLNLAIHLAGKRVYHEQDVHVITPLINNLVDDILNDIKEKKKLDLTGDLDLRMMLALHLVPLHIRMNYHMVLRNPMLNEIKLNLLYAYDLAVCASETIYHHLAKRISEDEIGYLALHLDIACNRKKENIERKKILIVCSSGKASAQLLEYKFKAKFQPYIQTLQTCKSSELEALDINLFDVIFTTVPIAKQLFIPVFEVQYLLGKEDVEKIEKVLNHGYEMNGNSILSCFDERLFFSEVNITNKKDVLRFLVEKIEEIREIPNDFLSEIMKREDFGATDLIHNVAFPHPNTSLTKDTFFAIAVLKKPILWSKHKVRLVFLASMSNTENMITDLYTKIVAELLSSQSALNQLIEQSTYEQLLSIIKEICKREGYIC